MAAPTILYLIATFGASELSSGWAMRAAIDIAFCALAEAPNLRIFHRSGVGLLFRGFDL